MTIFSIKQTIIKNQSLQCITGIMILLVTNDIFQTDFPKEILTSLASSQCVKSLLYHFELSPHNQMLHP